MPTGFEQQLFIYGPLGMSVAFLIAVVKIQDTRLSDKDKKLAEKEDKIQQLLELRRQDAVEIGKESIENAKAMTDVMGMFADKIKAGRKSE
jgi:low affinity Fe/Cu permease